eukprot:scaffold50412_cov33-Phaeocystis_antarctica.AAC.1
MRANLRHAAKRHDREGSIAEPPARKSAHRNIASNNLRRLQRINSQDERLPLRVEGERTPERQLAADAAARSGDLQTTIEYADGTRHTIQLWNEFRIWDPGD